VADEGPAKSQDDVNLSSDIVEMEIDDSFHDTSDSGNSTDSRRGEHVPPTPQHKADQASQFPEVFQARQGYNSVGDRRKRDLRAQIIEHLHLHLQLIWSVKIYRYHTNR